MRKYGVILGVAFALVLFFVVSSEAALTGGITGTIKDNTAQGIPGVQVSVTGTGLPGVRTDYSRENGKYRIVLLPPGTYTVKAELSGFKTLEKKGVKVNINQTVRLDLTMEVSTFEEVVTVTAEAPVLDTGTSSVGVNVNREFTERLPGSDSFQSAFAMGGGTVGGSNPNVHGATSTDNTYLYDGVDTTDPVTHTFSSNLNADAIEEVEVMAGGFSAEYGKAMGGIVNAVTKKGGNKFEGILRFKYDTDTFNAPVKDPDVRGDYKVQDHYEPTLSIGGPILKDRLWFFMSYRRDDYNSSKDVRTGRDFDSGDYSFASVDDDQLWQYFVAKLTWSVTSSHNIELSYSADPAVLHNQESVSYSPEAQQNWKQGGDRFGLNWTYIHSSNLYFDTKYGYYTSYIYIKPENDSGVPGVYDRKARIYYNNYPSTDNNDRSKWNISTAATYIVEDLAGSHEFKAGLEYGVQEEKRFFNYSGGESYSTDYYGTENEQPYSKTKMLDPKPEKNKGKDLSLYVQDNWEYFPGLTFNLGIRFDQAAYENKEGKTVHTFDGMIAPRIGASWDMKNDGKSKVFINFGRYYNTFDLQIVGEDPGPSSVTENYRWDPTNPNADADGYYLYSTTGGEDPGSMIDPNLNPEYKDEFIIGYDREIMPNWSAGVSFTINRTNDIIEDVGFWKDDAGGLHLATDVDINDQAAVDDWYDHWKGDQQNYIATNPSDAYRKYYAIELHTSARTEKFSAEISYTYSDSEGTNVNTQPGSSSGVTHWSVYFDTPMLSHNIDGPLDWDSPNYLKIFASYNLPWGFVIGTHTWYKSGYPYNKYGDFGAGPDGVFGTDDDVDHRDPAYRDGVTLPEGRGAYRLPDVFMVDLSLQKDFNFEKWGILTAMIDITNSLDNQLVLSRVEDEGKDFGTDNGWASPRTVVFQLKYAF